MSNYVDINQRIPLYILKIALQSYLDGTYTNDYIMEQLRMEYDGENRLKKSLRIVNKIIKRNPIIHLTDENKVKVQAAIKSKNDCNLILISLLNSAFPFSFDVLRIMGKFFSVQDVINAETIKKNVSNIYGGNRATENGIYSVVPMFLEAGVFKRPKQGIYEFENILNYSTEIAKEIFIASFNQNNTIKRTLNNYQHSDSYFMFID
tara:strand:- start:110 stop:727 length:618 start_codon:yes stop_codon:yes gene_type:complete